MSEQQVLIIDDQTGRHVTMGLQEALEAAAIGELGPHEVIVAGDSVELNRQGLLDAITDKRQEQRNLDWAHSAMFPFSMPHHPLAERLALPRRRSSKPEKLTACTLPGCEKLTAHNGGYCCADHCKEHRIRNKRRRLACT